MKPLLWHRMSSRMRLFSFLPLWIEENTILKARRINCRNILRLSVRIRFFGRIPALQPGSNRRLSRSACDVSPTDRAETAVSRVRIISSVAWRRHRIRFPCHFNNAAGFYRPSLLFGPIRSSEKKEKRRTWRICMWATERLMTHSDPLWFAFATLFYGICSTISPISPVHPGSSSPSFTSPPSR